MKNLVFITFLVISNTMFSQGFVNITVTGDTWSPFINISEAGNDYQTVYESIDSQTLLTINPNNKNNWVSVLVSRSNNAWHNNLKLKVRRTSSGTYTIDTIINGGSNYWLITENSTEFFICKGYPTKVPLQYEITGISVLLPVENYSTTIMYTVMYQ